MSSEEKRVHTRAQYFLLRTNDQSNPVPIYALRAADDTEAIPALVVDMSEGGVQILTTNSVRLEQIDYRMEIAGNEGKLPGEQTIHPVWSKPDGVNVRTGFAFVRNGAVYDGVARLLQGSPSGLLRCILHPAAKAGN